MTPAGALHAGTNRVGDRAGREISFQMLRWIASTGLTLRKARLAAPRPASTLALLGLTMILVLGCERGDASGGDEAGPTADLASLETILRDPDPLERARAVAVVLQQASPEDLEELLHVFQGAPQDKGDVEYALFAHWWAQFDPEAAFVFADSQLRTEHPRVILAIVRAWAHRDPLEALESGMLQGIEVRMPSLAPEFADALVVGWFESGRPGLEDWLRSQVHEPHFQSVVLTYARMRVLRDGEEETLQWTLESPFDEPTQRLLLAGALSTISHQDPALAREWLAIAEEKGVDTVSFVPRIANSWAHHDPQAALEWVLTFPEDAQRNQAIINISRRWTRRDLDGMQAWLDQQDGSKWNDILRVGAIRAHIRRNDYMVDWPEMMARAGRIVEERRQQSLMTHVLQRWFVVAPEDAEAWVAANPDALAADAVERARAIVDWEREEIERALERARARERSSAA